MWGNTSRKRAVELGDSLADFDTERRGSNRFQAVHGGTQKSPARRQVENQTVQRPVVVKIKQLRIVDGASFQGLYDLATPNPPPSLRRVGMVHSRMDFLYYKKSFDEWYTCTTACVRKLNTAACDLIARSVPKTLGSPVLVQ